MKTGLKATDREKAVLPDEPEANSNGEPARGLCINCTEADFCRLQSSTKEPVVHCEEYQNTTCPPAARDRREAADLALAPSEPPERAPGLCLNCDHADTCRLPKPEAGVWYCEEYE